MRGVAMESLSAGAMGTVASWHRSINVSDDPDCTWNDEELSEETRFACNNLQDDDGDGLVDSNDPGCQHAYMSDETHTAECSDSIDNDGDGWIDLQDPICTSIAVEFEDDGFDPNGLQYNDSIDNDLDGHVDPDDVQCSSATDNSEAF